MPPKAPRKEPAGLQEGLPCEVIEGTHAGKSGIVQDITVGATHGQKSITVVQKDGSRFKTLAKNVQIR